jgi:hypothetical protein
MMSRRIGPISPARTGTKRSDEADDTSAVWFDAFGLGTSHTTLAIGITPECGFQHERAARRSTGQEARQPDPQPSGWDRVRNCDLFAYRLPTEPFRARHEVGGYRVAGEAVEAVELVAVGNLLAEGLRRSHDTAPRPCCPFDFRLRASMAHVRRRVAAGLVDPAEDFDEDHRHVDAPGRAARAGAVATRCRRDVGGSGTPPGRWGPGRAAPGCAPWPAAAERADPTAQHRRPAPGRRSRSASNAWRHDARPAGPRTARERAVLAPARPRSRVNPGRSGS